MNLWRKVKYAWCKKQRKARLQERKKAALKRLEPLMLHLFSMCQKALPNIDVMGFQVGWIVGLDAPSDEKQVFHQMYYGGGSSFAFDEQSFDVGVSLGRAVKNKQQELNTAFIQSVCSKVLLEQALPEKMEKPKRAFL